MKRSARTPAGLFHLSPLAERGRIALAIRVREIRRKGGLDGFDNARHVSQYVIIPESQNTILVIGKPFRTSHLATPTHPARDCAPTSPRTPGEVSTPPVPA